MLLKCLIGLLVSFSTSLLIAGYTIMLEPARGSRDAGRIIGESFERGITLQWIQDIKQYVEAQNSSIKIVVTSRDSHSNDAYYNAQYANRLSVDLYVSIHCYYEPGTTSTITLYYCIKNPLSDRSYKSAPGLHFLSADQVHCMWHGMSKRYSSLFYQTLQKEGSLKHLSFQGSYGVPFRSLVGINAPAFAVEVGLINEQEWRHYTQVFGKALIQIAQEGML